MVSFLETKEAFRLAFAAKENEMFVAEIDWNRSAKRPAEQVEMVAFIYHVEGKVMPVTFPFFFHGQ